MWLIEERRTIKRNQKKTKRCFWFENRHDLTYCMMSCCTFKINSSELLTVTLDAFKINREMATERAIGRLNSEFSRARVKSRANSISTPLNGFNMMSSKWPTTLVNSEFKLPHRLPIRGAHDAICRTSFKIGRTMAAVKMGILEAISSEFSWFKWSTLAIQYWVKLCR